MPTSQLVLMILSFAGMFGFAGVAVWLWMRQQSAAPARPAAAKPPAKPPAEAKAAAAIVEVTEFVPLPGNREDDSPQPHPHAPAGATATEEPIERTEFIAAPLELIGRGRATHEPAAAPERTEFLAPFGSESAERTAFVPAPAERTAFIEPPVQLSPPPVLVEQRIERPDPVLATAADELVGEPIPTPPASDRVTDLREHFDLAAAALAQLERSDDPARATALHGHLEVLASAPIDPLLELVRPVIADPDPTDARHAAAWLALLQHKSWPAKRALPDLLAELDDHGRSEGLRALASWDDPRAPGLAVAGLEHASSPAARGEWLELFADRGWDPGDAAVDQALAVTDPRLLIAGLRLAGARPPDRVRSKVSAQLFASDPAVRIEAIETALVFAEQSAWLVCRQLARNPAFPRAAELVGLLGSEAELAQLCQAASVAGSAPILWGLGLSGRPLALEACAASLDDDELRSAAQAALALACGQAFDSPTEAREWLAGRAPGVRLIDGVPRTRDALARTLAGSDSPALRRAIARELRIRAGGRVVLTPELRPRAWRRQLDDLLALDVDLNRDFPWHH